MIPRHAVRRGVGLAAAVSAALLLLGCNRETKAQHVALGRALATPVSLICSTIRKEAGGCYGDCSTFLNAEDGRAYRRAAELLTRLPIVDDPHTEADIAGVRGASEAVMRAFGTACSQDIDRAAGLTATVTECANARRANGMVSGALRELVGQLASDTKSRVGVDLPSPERCPPQP